MAKNLPAMWETWVQCLGRIDPLRREWLPTLVFLPGEFHGQRSLGGYSLWGCRVGHDWAANTFTCKIYHINHSEMSSCEVCLCEVSQSRPTLCDPMDCSLPGSSVHGIFQARTIEWVAISSPGKDEEYVDNSNCVSLSILGISKSIFQYN